MKSYQSLMAALLILTACSAARGADFTGAWKVQTKTPRGFVERRFVFKQHGEKLTGFIVSPHGNKEAIENGKVSGELIEFSVVRRQPGGDLKTVQYKGKLRGEEIAGAFVGPGGHTIPWTARRGSKRSSKRAAGQSQRRE